MQVDGVAWWYGGDSLIPMPQDILREIYEETGHDFSGDICKGATLNSNFSSYRDYENLTLFLWLKNASFLSLY